MQSNELRYAPFLTRLLAFIVDSFIVNIFINIFLVFPINIFNLITNLEIFSSEILFNFTILDILTYIITISYFTIFTYFKGYTLGKYLCKIKVISRNNEKLTFFNILYRETIGRFLCGLFLFLGYIMVCFDSKKVGLHDYFADTYVVYQPR